VKSARPFPLLTENTHLQDFSAKSVLFVNGSLPPPQFLFCFFDKLFRFPRGHRFPNQVPLFLRRGREWVCWLPSPPKCYPALLSVFFSRARRYSFFSPSWHFTRAYPPLTLPSPGPLFLFFFDRRFFSVFLLTASFPPIENPFDFRDQFSMTGFGLYFFPPLGASGFSPP